MATSAGYIADCDRHRLLGRDLQRRRQQLRGQQRHRRGAGERRPARPSSTPASSRLPPPSAARSPTRPRSAAATTRAAPSPSSSTATRPRPARRCSPTPRRSPAAWPPPRATSPLRPAPTTGSRPTTATPTTRGQQPHRRGTGDRQPGPPVHPVHQHDSGRKRGDRQRRQADRYCDPLRAAQARLARLSSASTWATRW